MSHNNAPLPPLTIKRGGKIPSPLSIRGIEGVIDALPPKHFQKLIGVDGLGASGKSTIAKAMCKIRPTLSIIHVDEFYRPKAERTTGIVEGAIVSPDFEWDRLDGQVFDPIRRGFPVIYQSYDWRHDAAGRWVEIPQDNWIAIVGVYALQSRFFPYYDYTIWCNVSKEIRIQRMIKREGEKVAQEWLASWSAREERYFDIEHPDKRASLMVDNRQ